ncbi:hypothetical protein Taro_006546 [Colocasia esculenta]|uniref:Uncharacterized protein n=1 Tax=Colocasia esculenta TaxID=4460 RepID=A0A843TY11_COLES|nr:hypothetical protein [Colocasia esculenta]
MCHRLFRFNDKTMATRRRRGVGPSRGDESVGGSQAPAQPARDQTGVPLPPPPPPVDYGALMQGLVYAMQTQAQITAALQAQARVFAFARDEAELAEHVTEGTILIMGMHARVLFDTGATHSFVSEGFAKVLMKDDGLVPERLEVPLSVHTPAGTILTE